MNTNLVIPNRTKDTYFERTFAGDVTETQMYSYAVKEKLNVLMIGEAGTGKTSSSDNFANFMEWEVVDLPSNQAMDYTQIVGGLMPNDTGGLSWRDGLIVRALREGKKVIRLGEVNTLARNVQQFLMPMCDYRRYVVVPERDEVISVPDDVLIVADMNPSHYRGTQQLNQAWKDRFEIKLNFNYDRSIEKKIVRSTSLLDLAYGMRSTTTSQLTEELKSNSNTIFETPISTRILKTFEKLATGLNFDFACEVLINNFADEEKSAVRMMIEGASWNIKDELGISQEKITTNQGDDTDETL